MQRTSTTVIATVGGDAALLAHLGATSNVRAVITEGDAPPLDRAASAWAVVARTTTPYLVHDADPLAAVADAWTRRFDGLAPHGELELAVSETLARWRARRLELPDYYLLVEPQEWPATRRHWFLGFLAGLAPTRVLVADAPILTTLPRLPTGRWWPELDQLVDGIDRIVPDKAGLPAGGGHRRRPGHCVGPVGADGPTGQPGGAVGLTAVRSPTWLGTMSDVSPVPPLTSHRQSRPAAWREVLRTTNPPEGHLDPVSKWLVLTRAAVLPMTLTAGAVAGLLAVHRRGFNAGWLALAIVGITLAHVANNLMNDLFDVEVGSDTASYPRALYAPHPILSGMISRRGLATAALAVNVVDLGVLVVLTVARGWPILVFALGGFLLSVAYTAPPLRLKKRGLGEPDVLVVWGPLMVGGTYYAATGHIPWQIIAASIPYGLLCTAVLMGKHIDKIPYDAPIGIHTMPVVLGETRARVVTRGLMVAFYVAVLVCVIARALPWPALLAFGALPVLVQSWRPFGEPRPAEPPAGFPVWPLWFAAVAFVHTRRAGALLVAGLAVAAIFNIR